VTVALVCPDGFSVLLFCKGIIATLRRGGRARVLVLTDVGTYREELEALGVACVHVPISRFVAPGQDVRYLWALYRVFRRERCDAVLTFSTKPNIYGPIAAWMAGVDRVVVHVVGLGMSFLPGRSVKARLVQSVMRLLFRVSCRLSDRVWFTNQHDLAYFVCSGLLDASKSILTRNYLDTAFYAAATETPEDTEHLRRELGLRPGQVVVLMVARLIWAKGIREFAEASRLLRGRDPDCQFVLVAPAEPPSPQTVPEVFVRSYEANGNFHWLGFRRDVRRLYALCDVAVLPSYYKEGGYPRALLEPMSMGKPLITTTSEDCRGTVDDGVNGMLVPPGDAGALADAITHLARDPATRTAFGRCSREKAVSEFEERPILRAVLRDVGLVAGG
jgi:N,N'-diacetylbacillosaminyl-diphospho-undecaprenol alpha-1,3-N-acetylgalactosaminyltransferase